MRKFKIQKALTKELRWINYKLWKSKGKSQNFINRKKINLEKQEFWSKKAEEIKNHYTGYEVSGTS